MPSRIFLNLPLLLKVPLGKDDALNDSVDEETYPRKWIDN